MASTMQIREEITRDFVQKLEDVLRENFDEDIFYTSENLNTLTFLCGEVDGKKVYGSVKFTLHKSNYNLDEEIEKYELKREEKELKAKVTAQKKKEQLKKAEERKAKAAARQERQELEGNRLKTSIEEMKKQVNS